MTEVFHRGLVT